MLKQLVAAICFRLIHGGGRKVVIHYAPNIDARGADPQAVARLSATMAEERKNFERAMANAGGSLTIR